MIAPIAIFKLLLVFFLGSLYGLQRQKSHKPAGFGTFTLVAVGACSLSVLALELDLTRSIAIVSAIVTGVGFLGAGALIRNNDKVFGFTTAASIWFFAIFGMVIGLGYYFEGIFIYLIIWIAVLIDNYLEERGLGSYRKRLTITYTKFEKKKEISDTISEYSKVFSLVNISINKRDKTISSTYLIEGLKKEISALLEEFYEKPWCVSVKME